MKRTITSDVIATALKQEELGMPLADIIRQAGVSERTFRSWKKQYCEQPDFLKELKALQEENAHFKQIVAKLTLENARLKNDKRGKH